MAMDPTIQNLSQHKQYQEVADLAETGQAASFLHSILSSKFLEMGQWQW